LIKSDYSYKIEALTDEDRKLATKNSYPFFKEFGIIIIACTVFLFLLLSFGLGFSKITFQITFLITSVLILIFCYIGLKSFLEVKKAIKSNKKIIETGYITKKETFEDEEGGFTSNFYIDEQKFTLFPNYFIEGDKILAKHVLDSNNKKVFLLKVEKIFD
jgi:hypothetical protein